MDLKMLDFDPMGAIQEWKFTVYYMYNLELQEEHIFLFSSRLLGCHDLLYKYGEKLKIIFYFNVLQKVRNKTLFRVKLIFTLIICLAVLQSAFCNQYLKIKLFSFKCLI